MVQDEDDEEAEEAANHLLESVPAYNGEEGWEVVPKPANIKLKKSQVIAQKFPNGWHRGRVRGKATGRKDKGKWNVFFSIDYEIYACPLLANEYGVSKQWVYLKKRK